MKKPDFNWGDFAVIIATVLAIVTLWALEKHYDEQAKHMPTKYKGV